MKTKNNLMLILLATLPLFMSCLSNNGATQLEGNRKIVLQYHNIWSNGESEKLNEIMTREFVCHYLTSGEWKGIEKAKTEITNWRKLFPDWHEEVVDIIAENDKVVTRYNSTGKHSGTYEGIDSTGIKVEIY